MTGSTLNNVTGLWTPTDWDKEAALRIEYIRCLVQTWARPLRMVDLGTIAFDPATIMRLWRETGIMYVNSLDSAPSVTTVVTFEDWRELHSKQNI